MESAISRYDMAAKRRRNTEYVYQGVTNTALHHVFSICAEGIVPFGIPMTVAPEQRERLLQYAWNRGVHLATLVDKWWFIPKDRVKEYEREVAFVQSHFLVPISEFLTEEHMQTVVAVLNKWQ